MDLHNYNALYNTIPSSAWEIKGTRESLGKDKNGNDIFLKDIWPTNQEIQEIVINSINADMFIKRYSNVSEGPSEWQKIKITDNKLREELNNKLKMLSSLKIKMSGAVLNVVTSMLNYTLVIYMLNSQFVHIINIGQF